ncbi:MAG: MotA/TolQ/ExbB proton channel family protein [Deltaproteobacteria bacterium]|nr:MotA/TolQ/ExbB proton channel family protein [Deltaproteobacteria bacterium]
MERLWVFFKFRKGLKIFFPQVQKALKNGGREAASAICDINEPAARIFKAGLLRYKEGKTDVGEAMELASRQEALYLERYLGMLGTIGSTAPFVGLFGTVLGIIRAFHDLAVMEGAGPSVVADGIAEALVATAAGLFVAVPAVIAYNYFTRKINSLNLEVEGKAAEFLDALFEP